MSCAGLLALGLLRGMGLLGLGLLRLSFTPVKIFHPVLEWDGSSPKCLATSLRERKRLPSWLK